jgi:HlyD family secretion protein
MKIQLFAPLCTVIAIAGCSKDKPSDAPTSKSGDFSIVRVEKKSLPKTIEQPGTVQGYESTPLYAKIAGFVDKVYVDIGDTVDGPAAATETSKSRKWSILAEIRIPEMVEEGKQKEALVDQARAEVEQAKKQVEIAEASVAAAQAMIGEAKAGVKRAQANASRWDSEATRVAQMVKDKVIDPQTGAETEYQFASAKAALEEAHARVTVAEKAAVKAQAEAGKAEEDVKAADARLKVAEAESARLKSLLDYRFIRAPFDGMVTKRNVDTGHFVQPAGTQKGEPLFTVIRLDKVRIPVDVPESDAALIHKGDEATIRIPAIHGLELKGEVKRTSESLDPGSRTLRVEIELPNDDRRLRDGMYVYARITAPMPEAWTLPANAVVKQADQTVCFVYRDGKAVRLPIQPGRTDGKFTEVFKKQKSPGVWEDWTGDEQILSGQASTLADGQSVTLAK